MKKYLSLALVVMAVLLCCGYLCMPHAGEKLIYAENIPTTIQAVEKTAEDIPDVHTQLVPIENINPAVEEDTDSSMSRDWDAEESYLLAKIAMAEAEGEDIEGKAHVIMVVLNRVADNRFPNTIHDVIYQKNQFTPVGNGRFNRIEPNEECYMALDMIMIDKWDKSQGALYFESNKNTNNWHSRNLKYLFKHGCHRFYR